MTIPVVFPDDLEVHVRDERDDARLVAVVELVSPRNKDRPESRSAFAAKSAAYLYRGVGLVTLDVVTGRQFNLHNELIDLLRLDSRFAHARGRAAVCRVVPTGQTRRSRSDRSLAGRLDDRGDCPSCHLPLRSAQPVPLDLESAYDDACRRSRLSFPSP